MANSAKLMNEDIKVTIGTSIMVTSANIHPAAPMAAPVGMVMLVALVALAIALAMAGVAVLISEKMGVNAKARYKPTMKAIIAEMQAMIRESGTTGIVLRSLPSSPSLTPPTRGATRLYSKARTKLPMMFRKNEVKGARIITATPIKAKNPPNALSPGMKAATSPKAMRNSIAAINANIACMEAFIRVKGAVLTCLISLISNIFFTSLDNWC